MPHHPGERTYNFKAHEGQTLAGVFVVQQAESASYGACWLVRHPCGHEENVSGIQLRAAEKAGTKRRCFACHPKHQRIGQ